jgi:hypothetical protein
MIDARLPVCVLAVMVPAACHEALDLPLPSAEEVEAYYESDAGLEAEITGNVAVITVAQSAMDLRRGGALWAKVGPYVFLFSDATRRLLDDHPGLAAVRVVTRVGESQVASALLARDELSAVRWRRALNIAGRARRDGTHQVTLLEDLVEWGESHTQFEYNDRYTRR